MTIASEWAERTLDRSGDPWVGEPHVANAAFHSRALRSATERTQMYVTFLYTLSTTRQVATGALYFIQWMAFAVLDPIARPYHLQRAPASIWGASSTSPGTLPPAPKPRRMPCPIAAAARRLGLPRVRSLHAAAGCVRHTRPHGLQLSGRGAPCRAIESRLRCAPTEPSVASSAPKPVRACAACPRPAAPARGAAAWPTPGAPVAPRPAGSRRIAAVPLPLPAPCGACALPPACPRLLLPIVPGWQVWASLLGRPGDCSSSA